MQATGTNPSWFEHGSECVGSSVTEKPRGSRNPVREQTFSAACRSPSRPAWSPVVVQQAGRRLGQSKRRRDRLSWGPVLVPVAVTMVGGMWPWLWKHPRSPGPGSPLKLQTVRAGSGGKSEQACEGRRKGAPLSDSPAAAKPPEPRSGRQDSNPSPGTAQPGGVAGSIPSHPVLLPRPAGSAGWNGGVRNPGCSHGIFRVVDGDAPLTPNLGVIAVAPQWRGSAGEIRSGVLRLLIHSTFTQQTFAGLHCRRHDLGQGGTQLRIRYHGSRTVGTLVRLQEGSRSGSA